MPVSGFRVFNKAGQWSTEDVWVNNDATMDMSTGVVIGDSLFGFSPRNSGQYFAIDANTGQTAWLSEPRQGDNAAVVRAGDLWFALDTSAELKVARANAKQFEILKRYDVADSATWAQPVLSGQRFVDQGPVHDFPVDVELTSCRPGVKEMAGGVVSTSGGDMERERLTAKDFSPELLTIFDQYVHGDIDRRGFFDRAAKYVAAPLTAAMVLDLLNPKFAEAQQVPKDDKRIKTESVEIDSPKGYGKIKAYVAKPANATGKLPTVLVIHENRGLNPHIEDIARRLALDNFLAVAPDALSPLGGYPGDEDKAREVFPKLDQAKTREDFIAATNYARTRPDSTGKIGAVGFCYGGGMVNFLATRVPELLAGVPFYGGAAAGRGRQEHQGRDAGPARRQRQAARRWRGRPTKRR